MCGTIHYSLYILFCLVSECRTSCYSTHICGWCCVGWIWVVHVCIWGGSIRAIRYVRVGQTISCREWSSCLTRYILGQHRWYEIRRDVCWSWKGLENFQTGYECDACPKSPSQPAFRSACWRFHLNNSIYTLQPPLPSSYLPFSWLCPLLLSLFVFHSWCCSFIIKLASMHAKLFLHFSEGPAS